MGFLENGPCVVMSIDFEKLGFVEGMDFGLGKTMCFCFDVGFSVIPYFHSQSFCCSHFVHSIILLQFFCLV